MSSQASIMSRRAAFVRAAPARSVRAASTWGYGQLPPTASPSLRSAGSVNTFFEERGVSVDGTLAPKALPKRWKPKWKPAAQANPLHSLLRVERQGGARVVHLNSSRTSNRLNIMTVRALTQLLSQYESNAAITMVILRGAEDNLFTAGTDSKEFLERCKSAGSRATALSYLRAQYELQHLVATYTKPIVMAMHGVTLGSGFALASHSPFAYVCDNAVVGVPEVTQGMLPHGGSSYYLARTESGAGMYMALTGAVMRGDEAYWAGLAPMFAPAAEWSSVIAKTAGAVSTSPAVMWDMSKDPQYARALQTLRDFRADGKLAHVQGNMSEDVSKESFEEFIRLKRWYGYMAAGDRASAEMSLQSHDAGEDGHIGDLFDFNQSDEINGRERLEDPAFAAEDRRARFSAVSAYAAAINRGELDSGPTPEVLSKLRVLKRAFAGNAGAADPVLQVSNEAPKAARSRDDVLREVGVTQPKLAADWESQLDASLHQCLMAAYERMSITPVPEEVPVLLNAVRLGVSRAWPTGSLADAQLDDVCFSLGVPDRQQTKDLVSRGIAYVTARLLGEHRRARNEWVLEDPALLARERRALADAEAKRRDVIEDGFEITPRVADDIDGLYYDFNEDDLFYSLLGTPGHPDWRRELEFSMTVDDTNLASLAPATGVQTARTAVLATRARLLRILSQVPGGVQLYTNKVRRALTSAYASGDKRQAWALMASKGITSGMPHSAQRAVGRPDIPSTMGMSERLHDLQRVLVDVREEHVRAMLSLAGAGVASRLGLTPTAIRMLAELALDEEGEAQDMREAAEDSSTPATANLVQAWSTLTRAVERKSPTASGASAAAAGAGSGAPASGRLPADAHARLAAVLDRWVAAEVRCIGALRLGEALAAAGTSDANPIAAASEAYVVANDAATGAVSLKLRGANESVTPPTVQPGSGAPGSNGSGSLASAGPIPSILSSLAAAPASPLDAVAPLPASMLSEDGPIINSSDVLSSLSLDADSAKWDPTHVRAAMTDPQYLVDSFGLPRTPDTMAAAARVVDCLKDEADARVGVVQPKSVDEIVRRLQEIVRRGGADAANASARQDGEFAKLTLSQIQSLPSSSVRAVHALLVKASTVSLRQAMMMEYAGLNRLATGAASLEAVATASASVEEIASKLFAPLPKDARAAHLRLPERAAVRAHAASRAAQLSAWTSELAAYFESGTAGGALGDVVRRRYKWFKEPLTAFDGGYGADDASWAELQDNMVTSMRDQLAQDGDFQVDALSTRDKRWDSIQMVTNSQLAEWTAALEAEVCAKGAAGDAKLQ